MGDYIHFCAICKNKLKLKAKLSDKELTGGITREVSRFCD